MKLSDHYTCPHQKGQPRMNLLLCLGRWMVAMEDCKRSPCRKCTILDERIANMVKIRMNK